MVGKVVGSRYHWSSFCFIYWKILESKTLKHFTLTWYEPTKMTACNCLHKIMVRVTTSGSRTSFPCMLEPNAFAYSDFHLNDNLFPHTFIFFMSFFFSSFFFSSYTWKPLKERGGNKTPNTCLLRRWNITAMKNPDKPHCTVHSSSPLTSVACEYTHNYTV